MNVTVRFTRQALVAAFVLSTIVLGVRESIALDCSITFSLLDAVEYSALQYDVHYALARGTFRGIGVEVECEDLTSADIAAFNDDDRDRSLTMAFVSLLGTTGPRELARCNFLAVSTAPRAQDFEIEVTDAADADANQLVPTPNLGVGAIICPGCGDANGDGSIGATDALIALKAAVGSGSCLPSACDVNADGETTASDALLILRVAVGNDDIELNCQTTPTPTTTTTMPVLERRLSVEKTGTGTGRVTSSPSGINCGADCEEFYIDGTRVTLSASADATATFAGWGGSVPASCAGSLTDCTFKMGRNRNITAAFNRIVSTCPTNGPITDLRNDCSSFVYIYRLGGLVEGLTTDGRNVVMAQTDGFDVIGYVGRVTGARSFSLDRANVNDSPFIPLDSGSGTISSTGRTLSFFVVLGGDRFTFNGATWVDTSPLAMSGLRSSLTTDSSGLRSEQFNRLKGELRR